MAIKTIPLSRLETDLEKTLNECAESGQTLVVEMPDQQLSAIQALDPQEDDTLNLHRDELGKRRAMLALLPDLLAGA
jgi:hypothetical protein